MPAWLETAAPAERADIATALMDDRFASVADPAGSLRQIGDRLEILARGSRDSDEHAFAEGSAGTGGSKTAAMRIRGAASSFDKQRKGCGSPAEALEK